MGLVRTLHPPYLIRFLIFHHHPRWCLIALVCFQQNPVDLSRVLPYTWMCPPGNFSSTHLQPCLLSKNPHSPWLYLELSPISLPHWENLCQPFLHHWWGSWIKSALPLLTNVAEFFFFNTCDFSFCKRRTAKVKTEREFYNQFWTLTFPLLYVLYSTLQQYAIISHNSSILNSINSIAPMPFH